MGMERFETLEKKIRRAAERLHELRKENHKLLAEIKVMDEENKRAKLVLRENESFLNEKKTISNRIEKIIRRINSLQFGQS